MEEKDKKEYELAVLLKNEEDMAPVLELVRQHNGEMVSEPRAKRLTLAYEIKKHKEAVFSYFTFRSATENVKALEHDLNTKAEVIRFLVLASPAPAMVPTGDHPSMPTEPRRRTRIARPTTFSADAKPAPSQPLSNEALEKKIEEILQ